MRSILTLALAGALLCTSQRETLATQIRCAGVLGNSGEQGKTLVRFGPVTARGLGIVADESGTLWDRGGDGVLNRYARDGRLMASYTIPTGPGDGRMTRVGNLLVFLLGGRLHSLAIDAAPQSDSSPLDVATNLMSLNTIDNLVIIATSEDKTNYSISQYNPATRQDTPLMDGEIAGAREIAMSPDHGLLAAIGGKLQLFRAGKKVVEGWPRSGPGDRLQWIDGYWYGSAAHGTIRRFNAELEPDPGVVLGGASGSFIGHVDGNTEIEASRGLAKLSGDLYAASGWNGIIHLLRWDKVKTQFSIVRRIGAVPVCEGLGLNRQGQVLFYTGHWNWDDDPSSALRDCASGPKFEKGEMGQVVMLPNDNFIAPARRYGTPAILGGPFSWKATTSELPEETPKAGYNKGSAVYTDSKRRMVLLTIDGTGKGESYRVDIAGKMNAPAGPVTLQTATPVKEWTSLAMKDNDTLLGAADGAVIQMMRDGENWKETRRWKSWKAATPVSFGNRIYISGDAGNLWVSDTDHHRVLCFDMATEALRATFGVADKAGDTLTSLNGPQTLAAREKRAVVFDSGNQRLLKLTLTE